MVFTLAAAAAAAAKKGDWANEQTHKFKAYLNRIPTLNDMTDSFSLNVEFWW